MDSPLFIPVEKARVLGNLRARLTGRSPVPPSIGRYTLRGRLGHGAHGVVYRAHDPSLDRDVALKVLHIRGAASAQRVMAEAHALARVAHPNVVSVYDAGTAGDTVFVAMELVVGQTLRDWLGQPRTARATHRVLLDAGRGLAAAHAAGVVHGDFKPGNVMLGDDGRVRVVDFGMAGLCSPTSAESPTHIVGGTRGYLAPERHHGRVPTVRSDQFSFCVTFHEALTRGGHHEVAELRWTEAFLRPILARGLRADPSQRHPSMAALLRRFERRHRLARRASLLGSAAVGAMLTSLVFS